MGKRANRQDSGSEGLDAGAILDRAKSAYGFESDTELWRHLGVSSAVLSNWRRRNSIDLALIAARCGDRSLDYIVYGRGSATEPSATEAPSPRPQPPPGMIELFTRALDAPIRGHADAIEAAGLTPPELAEIAHHAIDALARAAAKNR